MKIRKPRGMARPGPSGQRKVADMLIKFFHTDPFAKTWYEK